MPPAAFDSAPLFQSFIQKGDHGGKECLLRGRAIAFLIGYGIAVFAAAGLSAQVTVAAGAQGYAEADQEGYDPAAQEAIFTALVALLDETLK